MSGEGRYGPTLTEDEYEHAVVELQKQAPQMPTPEQDRDMRRRALDLAIDHRLGRNFPADRRQALWEAAERVEARRVRLGLTYLVTRLFSRGEQVHGAALVRTLEQEYGPVLDRDELKQFLGLAPGTGTTPPDNPDG